MKPSQLPGISEIKSMIFGEFENPDRIYVYLHGSGEFGQGFDGQYKYPGFATLLRDNKISLCHPFVIACCMDGL